MRMPKNWVQRLGETAVPVARSPKLSAVMVMATLLALTSVNTALAAGMLQTRSVDMQTVLLQSNSGKKAKEQLSLKAARYEAEKTAQENSLKKLKTELEQQAILLSKAALNAKEQDYQTRLKEYQLFLKNAQDDLQAENDRLTKEIVAEIGKAIQDYGRIKGYSFIMVKNENMLYLDDSVDVTEEVLAFFNKNQ